jgi:hypothetical protein
MKIDSLTRICAWFAVVGAGCSALAQQPPVWHRRHPGAYLMAQKAGAPVTTPRNAATRAGPRGDALPSPDRAPSAKTTAWPKGDGFRFTQMADRLLIAHSGRPVAEFVFRDERILRPYFANLHAPDGTRVTRNHPPVPGVDATDHETMHPGLWLAFGDISGQDFWRNKGRIEHVRFLEPPSIRDGRLSFATESRLRGTDGRTLSGMTNRLSIGGVSNAWHIVWEATFRSNDGDFTFGDQEEMGFGARVATALTEKNGGRIVSSSGKSSAKDTWGQPADWSDYSGLVSGKPVGITLLADPTNFRPSWWHNRDYGVFVANPFGRAAMKQGDKSAVTVKRGETLRLRFGAVIHHGGGFQPAAAFENFRRSLATPI